MAKFSPSITKLIAQLGSLPGIGSKTAQRLAFHILTLPEEKAGDLAQAILDARALTNFCSRCFDLTDQDPCLICSDESREQSILCVVESPNDVAAMERTDKYKGYYHVLHGALSPMKNVGPQEIRLAELFSRLQRESFVEEVILATNATVEGEATAMYIARLLKPSGIKTTRIAHGIPMGSNLEYADEMTIAQALDGRREL